jgi:hypothetical protein
MTNDLEDTGTAYLNTKLQALVEAEQMLIYRIQYSTLSNYISRCHTPYPLSKLSPSAESLVLPESYFRQKI